MQQHAALQGQKDGHMENKLCELLDALESKAAVASPLQLVSEMRFACLVPGPRFAQ